VAEEWDVRERTGLCQLAGQGGQAIYSAILARQPPAAANTDLPQQSLQGGWLMLVWLGLANQSVPGLTQGLAQGSDPSWFFQE
jgi:hypothetical protein